MITYLAASVTPTPQDHPVTSNGVALLGVVAVLIFVVLTLLILASSRRSSGRG